MPNSYDKDGNYIGQTDSKGNHWDKNRSYAGQTDANGNHWDKNGSYAGQTDANGNHWDKNGNYVGKTDANGNSWDRGGSYAGKNTRSSDNSDSSSSGGGGLEILLAIIALASAVIGAAIIATPIIAPILLVAVENAKKKGDLEYVKKWESWSKTASLIAILVTLVAAGALDFVIATSILRLTASSTSSVLTTLLYIVAIIVGIISFALLFTTGISPTALIYLKNKESFLLSTGEIVKAQNLQRYSSVIKTTAISTIILTVAIFIIIPLASATTRWVSTKIQASIFSPSTAVQNPYTIVEPTKIISTPTSTEEATEIVSTLSLPTVQVFTPTLPPLFSNVPTPKLDLYTENTEAPIAIIPTVFKCPKAPKTRVNIGGDAIVIEATTRLRSSPEVNENIIFLLAEKDILEIKDGPVCSPRPNRDDYFVFWKVTVPSRSLEGWVAEGDSDFYFIQPYQ